MAITFEIINSGQTLRDSDKEAYDSAQSAINGMVMDAVHNGSTLSKPVKKRISELKAEQAETQWAKLQKYLDLRREAYKGAYGSGSYPYKHDEEDLQFETQTILFKDESRGTPPNIIGGFHMTYSPAGDGRKLRFEKKKELKDVEKMLSYRYSPDEVKNMKYGERGSFVIDPKLQHEGLGTAAMLEFFRRMLMVRDADGEMRYRSINGEKFFVVEAYGWQCWTCAESGHTDRISSHSAPGCRGYDRNQ